MESSSIAPRVRLRQCPHCDSEYVTRSRHQGFLALFPIRWLRLHRYRCTECWRRFYGFSRS
jgi:DNA-directed RNA polymerase subunit RPC12/RpoP